MSLAINVQGLSRRFGPDVAVDAVDLAVPTGVMYGLVGPNGAGKTTLMSMMSGLLRPDSGSIEVCGRNLWLDPEAAKQPLGVLADSDQLLTRLTGLELVTYMARLQGVPPDQTAHRSETLLNRLGLWPARNKLVLDYSAGMTKKIALAAALIHRPRVLLLDEPFEAVDPVSANTIRGLLSDFVHTGGTVLMSSHVMQLVEELCSHVAVMSQARILAAGPLESVRSGIRLQERFLELVGPAADGGDLSWLHS